MGSKGSGSIVVSLIVPPPCAGNFVIDFVAVTNSISLRKGFLNPLYVLKLTGLDSFA